MTPTQTRKRLTLLIASIALMLVLLLLNIRRSSDDFLPPTPTPYELAAVVENGDPAGTATPPASTRTATPSPSASLPPAEQTLAAEGTLAAGETATSIARETSRAQRQARRATQYAQAMANIVRVLQEDGAVTTLEGDYITLEDAEYALNRPGYTSMQFSEYSATDFVLRMNMLWDNAGLEISYPTAGCGLAFGYRDLSNHFRLFLNLDGNLRTHRIVDGRFSILSIDYYGELDRPAGHANLIVAVEDSWLSVYVNNLLVTRLYDEAIGEGYLGFTIASGSGVSYGTLCEFKDIELWLIE